MGEIRTESDALNLLADGIYSYCGPNNVGVLAPPKKDGGVQELYLIDSGINSAYAKKIFDECTRVFKNFAVRAVINTHCHSDHSGGSGFWQKECGAEVWATHDEKCYIEVPETHTAISSGGFPMEKFMEYYRGERAFVDREIKNDDAFSFGGMRIECVPLPGHSIDQIGLLVTNTAGQSALFAGDAVFGRSMLSRYWMPYLYDVRRFKESLSVIGRTRAALYVPSHGAVYDEIESVVEFNMLSTVSNEKCIEKILCAPHSHEELLKEFADINGIPLRLSQYFLVGSTIRSYLSYLESEGRVRYYFKDNRMLWQKTADCA